MSCEFSIFDSGSTFREDLLRFGELRSILPEGTPIMALTATAPRRLRFQLSEILGMKKALVPSNKDNIFFSVAQFESWEKNLTSVFENKEQHIQEQ